MARQLARILLCVLIVSVAPAANSGIAGIWDGTENDLPAVELTLHVNDGRITGSIGFYFQTRGTDGKWHLGEKYTVPLLSPKLEGRKLTFETIHHKCDGCPELGPNNKYQVDFVGEKEARIRILKDQKKQDDQGFKLTRE
jgi:hypothetical protein